MVLTILNNSTPKIYNFIEKQKKGDLSLPIIYISQLIDYYAMFIRKFNNLLNLFGVS